MDIETYRQKLLQLKPHAPSNLHTCLTQMWYNLLTAETANVNRVWCRHMSDSCRRDLESYFRKEGAGLDLR